MVSVTTKICSLSPKLSIRVSFHIPSNSVRPSTQSFQTVSYKVQPLFRFLLSTFLLVVMVPHTTRLHSLPRCSQIPLDYPSGLVPMLFNGSKFWENNQGSRRILLQARCHLPLLPRNTSVYTDLFFLYYGIFFLLPCLCTRCSFLFHLTLYHLATPYRFFKIHISVVLTSPSPGLDSPPSLASHSPLYKLYHGTCYVV